MKEQSNNTLFVGKVAIHLAELPSTNSYARELLSKSTPIEGTVIRTDDQTAGRGQFGSSWQAKACQNITISLLLRPKFLLVQQQFLLNVAICLGIYDFFNQYPLAAPLKVKWPNDIYIGNEKIGGVLIENRLRGNQMDWSIIGIGLNILQKEFEANLPNPTALILQTQKKLDLDQCHFQLYAALERQYIRMRRGDSSLLLNQYIDKLYLKNTPTEFYRTKENDKIMGEIVGVNKQGLLLVESDEGQRAYNLKEISPLIRN